MNRPDKFKAPFIPRERIWQETEKLRAAYPAGRIVPVQVLELAEFDLGLELIPAEGLREELEIDALLMGDLKSILVDRRAFMNPRMEYRLRFSVAHEIGHLILHRDIYGRQKHASARETEHEYRIRPRWETAWRDLYGRRVRTESRSGWLWRGIVASQEARRGQRRLSFDHQ
ncbi:MAG: ImmA/IrrE family metallo-endopeptidase [Verrucomicrobiia bacterium]